MTIAITKDPHPGRVYYVESVETAQLDQVESILGPDFAKSAAYAVETKWVYTPKLPDGIKTQLTAAGFRTSTCLAVVF